MWLMMCEDPETRCLIYRLFALDYLEGTLNINKNLKTFYDSILSVLPPVYCY